MDQETVYRRRWWTLAVLCLSLVVIGLDNTIVNIALPTLVQELAASNSQLQWIVDAYIVVFAGLLLAAGNLGDRYGRKRALNLGFLIFIAGSLLAAYSGSPGQLIASRAFMGVGGALIMPSTLSILVNVFPPDERPRAIAIWAGAAGIGIPLGPVVGGWLLEHFWWGSVFLINLPIIGAALLGGVLVMPESRDPEASPLDIPGALLSIAGLMTLVYGIIEAPEQGWLNPLTLIIFAVALVLLAGFVLWERRVAHPMLNLRLFKNPRLSAASTAILLAFFALLGSVFLLTQYLQFVLGYSALEAGIRIAVVALGIMTGVGISARLVPRIGTRFVVAGGMTVVAVGLAILSTATATSGYGIIALGLVVTSFGMGNVMSPATDAVMGSVPQANAGIGGAINDTTRQVGGALGVAVLGSLFSTYYSANIEGAVQRLPAPAAEAAQDSIGAALQIARQAGGEPGQALAQAANAGFVDAMEITFLAAAGIALVGAVLVLAFLPSHEIEPESGTSGQLEVESAEA